MKLQSGTELQISIHNRVLIVTPSGELDHFQAERLRSQIDAAYDKSSCRHMIISMEGITFMDSSGIGLIIGRYKKAESSGGRLIVSNMSESVSRLFDLSGLAKIIQRADTVNKALDILGVGGRL